MAKVARVEAELVRGEELQPGDLFSTGGPEYWAVAMAGDWIGEKVYIRTNASCPPGQRAERIFRLRMYWEETDEV